MKPDTLLHSKIEAAPEVSEQGLNALVLKKNLAQLTKFETDNIVQETQNHLTGFLETTHVSKHDFARERLHYELVASQQQPKTISKKQQKREIKKLRQNSGNPEDENYKGPWAVYEGMEEYDP